jgi:predicted GNAT family N-acyltransferase
MVSCFTLMHFLLWLRATVFVCEQSARLVFGIAF